MSLLATRSNPGGLGPAEGPVEHRWREADIVRAVDTPDSALVARMVAGDEDALGEVWQRHGPTVFGHARRVTGSPSIAEDIVQEVFVGLWSHPERFDPDRGTLRAYLGVHARRRAIDALRQDTRRATREKRHDTLHARRECPPDDIEITETSRTVRDAINRLPGEQRQVVELAYFGGLTHGEIATRLGIPEGTAKSRLRLAQAKLRSWLGPELEGVR